MNNFIEILLNVIVSTFILYILQAFWEYLKDNYSIRKKKNLIDTQMHKYKQIMSEINHPPHSTRNSTHYI